MKKKLYAFTALTLAAGLSLSGCKSREKIDISSIHTTAAETMAPTKETMANESQLAKEKESATASADSAAETKKGQDASSALSVRSQTATYKDGKVSIEYPILSNLRDEKTQETVNALIKEKATQLIKDNELNPASDTVSVKCNIISLDRNKAVLTYEGSMKAESAAYPTGVFYTTTVDLNKGTLIGLSDYADAYTMAGYIVSDDCIISKPADSPEVKETVKSKSLEEYWEILKQCDFTADGLTGFPQSFSYENQGSIYISIPTIHAVGDYAIIRFTPDTK